VDLATAAASSPPWSSGPLHIHLQPSSLALLISSSPAPPSSSSLSLLISGSSYTNFELSSSADIKLSNSTDIELCSSTDIEISDYNDFELSSSTDILLSSFCAYFSTLAPAAAAASPLVLCISTFAADIARNAYDISGSGQLALPATSASKQLIQSHSRIQTSESLRSAPHRRLVGADPAR
jgi:hypothetical protein